MLSAATTVGQPKVMYHPNMGVQEDMDIQFGRRVFNQRKRLGWSQDELAKRLSEKGLPVYASTIAKIESKHKPRAVRLAEAAAIADLFGVSMDTLLGRSVAPEADEMYTLRALLDTAQQAAWQLSGVEQSLRDQVAQLAAFAPKGHTKTISDECARACDMLAQTHGLIRDILFPPKGAAIQRFTRKMLIEALQREEDHDAT
jgi:transcriptional regulator with XRE-family HTH domain